LATLRNEGILFVGGRSNYHNVGMLGPESKVPSAAFDHWLQDTLEGADFEKRAIALAA